MNNWLKNIQSLLIPARCVLCAAPGCEDMDLCRDCRADLCRNLVCCQRCGLNLPGALPQPLCGRCLRRLPHFDTTQAPFVYDAGMRYLITQLKFHRHYLHGRLLGQMLADHLDLSGGIPQCIIPVPLHAKRYRERGFNQSLEIARHVGRQLHIDIDYRSCIRSRDTLHQSELPAKQRKNNMKNAFAVIDQLDCQHIAILDDVMTTGATMNALAQALKKHGVARVDVWVCARA